MTRLRKAVRSAALLLAAALAVGAIYQSTATARDDARFPMPGQRVDVGGRSLHLYCTGEGSPTVLLENGLAGVYPAWQRVQSQIAAFTRTCSYDRAGFGWSDPAPGESVSAQSVADDLTHLVAAAALPPPYVLVGWSAGGVYVRRYYHEHPQEVIGMVLVDSSHEQQRTRLNEPDGEAMRRAALAQLDLCRAIAWTGLVRAANVMETMAAPLAIPADVREPFVALENRTSYCSASRREFVGFASDTASTEPPASLGDLPLVVISRGRPVTATEAPDASVEELEALDASWRALQAELSALSTRTSHRIASDSGHAIPLQAPDAVVRAVKDVIEGQI